jgi:glyoxylase-like metal-dependent hydrolase (beta-lactamase superfamily II)
MLKIKTIVVGSYACNCRIVYDEQSSEAIVIDPGDEGNRIVNFVADQNLKLKAIVHTHAHFDHCMATGFVKTKLGSSTYLHANDLPMYETLATQCQMFGLPFDHSTQVPIDVFLKQDLELTFGSFKLKTIETPGHSPGSCCFLLESDDAYLFSGDTLFWRSIGRTDLWGSDSRKIIKSIKEQLYVLDLDTLVLPGHGRDTNIREEKKENPFCAA